ncbi:MAG: carboxypeptidase-like regulatory domain-containing protein [Sedimentisphaerales bacterium]|jgi:hypothetical protein
MRNIIFCTIIFLCNLPAFAIGYKDFPPDLQRILDQRITDVNANEGICVAGKIVMSDGAQIKSGEDVMANLYYRVDEPLWVYKDGWFIMGRAFSPEYAGEGWKLMARAFGYEPNDVSITILQGEITYAEVTMQKVPAEKLSSVAGIVVGDQNEPINGAKVILSFPFSNHGYRGDTGYTYPHKEISTDQNGKYSFEGLASARYSLLAAASGYAFRSFSFAPSAGAITTEDLKFYRNLKITIDYVYQADGNRSFTEGELKTGTVEWVNGNDGIDFSEGKVKGNSSKMSPDLGMRQDQDVMIFQIFYGNGKGNGFYDAGEVDLESITEAAESGYSTGAKPCVAGHVYVVKTYENNYAKFIVRSISVNK